MSTPTLPLMPGRYYHVYNRGINSCPIFYDEADHERFLYLYGKYVGQVANTLAWVLMRTHFHFLIKIKEDVVYRFSMEEIRRMERALPPRANASRSPGAAGFPGDATGFCPANAGGFCPSPEEALAFAKWETMSTQGADRQDSTASAGRASGRPGYVCKDDEEKQERLPNITGWEEKESPDLSGHDNGKSKKTPNPSSHLGHLFNAYARYFNLKYHRHGSLFEHQFKRKLIDDERYLKNVVIYIHKNPEHHGYYSDFRKYKWSSYHSFTHQPVLISKEEVMEWFGDKVNFSLAHGRQVNIERLEEWLYEK
jgi:putative transposase